MADGPPSQDFRPASRFGQALRIVSVLSLAFDIKKLAVAAVGIVLLQGGWWVLEALYGPPAPLFLAFDRSSSVGALLNAAQNMAMAWPSTLFVRVAEPYALLIAPFMWLIQPIQTWSSILHALCCLIWAIVVWSFVGGMICRMAAIQLCHSRRASLGEAWAFTKRRAVDYLIAPLCPLLGIAVCILMALPFGLLYWIPWVGPVLAGLFFAIPLALGLVITLLATGLIVGWPLLPAAVAIGADDPLDALSRTFAYLNQRLGFFALMVSIACGVGLVGLVFVDVVTETVILVTRWSVSISAPASAMGELVGAQQSPNGIAASLHGFWIRAVRLVADGWIYSFFWSAAAMIYLIIRHDVDGTQWNQIDPPVIPGVDRNANLPLATPAEPAA